MVTQLLPKAAARDVEAAIARVESMTSAELVVAVLRRSSSHVGGRALVAICWALAAELWLLRSSVEHGPLLLVLVQVITGGVVFFAGGWPPVHRWLIAPARAERAAHARAFQLFAERGLYATRGRTALLIFVSELERRVILLGDATIHAELGQTGWEREVKRLLDRIRQGRLRDGLLEVLEELAPRLALVAPPTPDDQNELPDALVRD